MPMIIDDLLQGAQALQSTKTPTILKSRHDDRSPGGRHNASTLCQVATISFLSHVHDL